MKRLPDERRLLFCIMPADPYNIPNREITMAKMLLKLFVKDYQNKDDIKVREKVGLVASVIGLVTNFFLFLSKIVIGFLLGIYSVVSDSVNNLSDFGNNVLSIFGVKAGAKPADKDHPYGHQRMEYVISLIISCVIIALGAIMIYQGIRDSVIFIMTIKETGKPPIKTISPIMVIVSFSLLGLAILLKLLQAYVYFSFGKYISSMQLKALGKDATNDCISTSFVIIGLFISWLTTYDLDCFFTIIVAVLVIVSGFGIMKEAVNSLLGEKPSKEMIDNVVNLVLSHEDVLGVHDLFIHMYGKAVYGVIHVEVDARKDVMESHELCDGIEHEAFEKLRINLTVHMDPIYIDDPDTSEYRRLVNEALSSLSPSIHMHDFRILSGKEHVNLIFDLILPPDFDNDKGREKVEREILQKTDRALGKQVHLAINYDSEVSDLLSGTKAEERNR